MVIYEINFLYNWWVFVADSYNCTTLVDTRHVYQYNTGIEPKFENTDGATIKFSIIIMAIDIH
jgi:hypothetical protein